MNIPLLGVGMAEGTILEWLVEDGELVEEGTPIYVLETDKVEQEVSSPAAGTIKLIGEEGTTYEVGVPIAEIS